MKTKYNIGDKVFVVDVAEYVNDNMIKRIPLGTPVKVTEVAVLKAKKAKPVTRYNVAFFSAVAFGKGKPCWIDEDRLSSAIIDVTA